VKEAVHPAEQHRGRPRQHAEAGLKQDRISKIILQDVLVLAAGQTVEMRDNKPVSVTTVTLAITRNRASVWPWPRARAADADDSQPRDKTIVETKVPAAGGATQRGRSAGADSERASATRNAGRAAACRESRGIGPARWEGERHDFRP
jgi:Flp pilus assembly protein CpaB